LVHIGWTTTRLLVGFVLGVFVGISIGVAIFKYKKLNLLLMPSLQAIRAIPAIATVPFFILWFGFSETGKFIMVIIGISFNLAIATEQILENIPERYRILFRSYGKRAESLTFSYILPTVFENILPTILFSLSTAIGLVIVSELLGSQVGLGYLIQNSRSTYSMHVIFLATILLGIINTIFDNLIRVLWKKIVFWGK
jgi:ABC-type nitrate/sulfonate/bicarbonate transport system permease component